MRKRRMHKEDALEIFGYFLLAGFIFTWFLQYGYFTLWQVYLALFGMASAIVFMKWAAYVNFTPVIETVKGIFNRVVLIREAILISILLFSILVFEGAKRFDPEVSEYIILVIFLPLLVVYLTIITIRDEEEK